MSLILDILNRAAVELRQHAYKENEILLNCPFCVGRGLSDDEGFHLGINVERGLSHCFRCGFNARDVMWAARALSQAFNVPFRLRYVIESGDANESMNWNESSTINASRYGNESQPRTVSEQQIGLPKEYEAFDGGKDSIERKLRGYLNRRGISASQIIRHRIGYAAMGDLAWRIIFPVLGEDGKVYGCVGRAANDSMKPKYLNSRGIKLLWGCHVPGHTAVVCEGIFDAISAERALMRRRGTVALARLGSTISPVQLQQLKKYERRIIIPDWDIPGVRGAIKFAQVCAQHKMSVEVAVPECMSGADPGSMSAEQIEAALGTAQKWSKGLEYRLRMAMAI